MVFFLKSGTTRNPINYNGTVEDAMRFMLGRMAAVPLLQIAEGTGDKTKIQFQATYKNVLEYLTKLARYAEIGFRVVPDFKKKTMTFETRNTSRKSKPLPPPTVT